MSHRSYGETRNCKGCRFWSEMLAQANGGGPVEAYCLSESSPSKGQYMPPHATCEGWKSGVYGAIDEPGIDYEATMKAYAVFDGKQSEVRS